MANAKFKNQVLEPQISELGADGVLKIPEVILKQMNIKRSIKVWIYSFGDILVITPYRKKSGVGEGLWK